MKILSITYNPYNNNNNNSKTMRSFFDGIPSKDLAMLYMESFSEVDYNFCDNYYRVTDQDVLRSVVKLQFKTRNTHPKEKLQKVSEEKIVALTRSKRTALRRLVREFFWNFNTWDTKEFDEWIQEQKPDIIFTLLGANIFMHNIVLKISKRYNIPFVAYYTDDYVLNCSDKTFWGRIHFKLTNKVYRKTMSKTSKSYVIGELMQKDYSKAFNREFGLLGNCIDLDKFNSLLPQKINTSDKITISFIGGLHLNRWQTVCDLGEIVKEINREKHWNIEINVYALELKDDIVQKLKACGVDYKGGLNSQGVFETIKTSDILLHVESFDEVNRTFVKYSVSTKISEYLASKRCIMAYGPHEVASVALIKDNDFGCVLTDLDSREDKKQKIITAIETYNDRDYSKQWDYVQQYYNKDVVREMLLKDMQEVVDNHFFNSNI